MKVHELIEKLKEMPQDVNVFVLGNYAFGDEAETVRLCEADIDIDRVENVNGVEVITPIKQFVYIASCTDFKYIVK